MANDGLGHAPLTLMAAHTAQQHRRREDTAVCSRDGGMPRPRHPMTLLRAGLPRSTQTDTGTFFAEYVHLKFNPEQGNKNPRFRPN
jgi:hypothetical protein